MKLSTVKELLNAKVISGKEHLGRDVFSACGSDMMSDVLAYVKDQAVLLTGLVNSQVIRTAEMMDMVCVVMVRSKWPTEEMIDIAERADIVLLTTEYRMYEACGQLSSGGLIGEPVRRE